MDSNGTHTICNTPTPAPPTLVEGGGGGGGGGGGEGGEGTLEVEASKYTCNRVHGEPLSSIVKISLILLKHCQHLCDFIIPVYLHTQATAYLHNLLIKCSNMKFNI